MPGLELLGFQEVAARKLVDAALDYFSGGQDVVGGRPVPFVGQLQAVTGAGKTPILASVVGRLAPAIVLWTTKFGSVVEQTVSNLRGKYNGLLGNSVIDVVNFSDVASPAQWDYIIERTDGLTILVSTVAAWNSSQKDERLNVHRPCPDWGEKTRWDRLKVDRKRPLWVVYDEAHNTTTEQVELLDDLNPSGFFVASASALRGRLQFYLSSLPPEIRAQRIIPVSTRDVVDEQLLKSTISLADYDSDLDEMVLAASQKRAELEERLHVWNSPFLPKAIYVVETSNAKKGEEARPVSIWRTLVNRSGVPPENIAICTATKELPREAIRVASIDQLSDTFTHIVFNKTLQEGWDDPSVYICYFDGKTSSATRIQQVLGRAVRQPGMKHFSDEDLNTAYFYVNCPNDLLEKITDQLKEELRVYKDGEIDFEPFQFKEERKPVGRIQVKDQWKGKLVAPTLQLEMPPGDVLKRLIEKKTFDFSEDDRRAQGSATINIVSVKTGDVVQSKRDLLEDMRVRTGAYLYEQIRSSSKNCASAIHPDTFVTLPLNRSACHRSKALEYYRELALQVVREYENHVRLTSLSDWEDQDYKVGAYQPSTDIQKVFDNAAHQYYDSKAFREDELEVAKALDKFPNFVWARNKDRLDYGIPLPVKSGSSSTFYPDFLWWVKDTVWAIDPTGIFILQEKLRTKLMFVPEPLKIALVSRRKLSSNFTITSDEGWTLLRFRTGNSAPETFDTIDDVLETLVQESV